MRVRWLAALILCFCALPTCQATSYYYVFYNGVFYIGGDTLFSVMPVANVDSNGRKAALQFGHDCKMLVSNTFVVSPLGWNGEMLFIPDKKGNLVRPVGLTPLYARIRTILSTAKDVDSTLDQLLNAAEKTSTDLFDYRRKIGAPDVASPGVSLSIFYWRDGHVYNRVVQVKSSIRNHQHIVVPTMSAPRALIAGTVEGFGLLDAMMLPPRPAEVRLFSSYADIIPYNLNKQSDMTPNAVGPPFTIFKLSPTGGEWSTNGDMCRKNSFLKQPVLVSQPTAQYQPSR